MDHVPIKLACDLNELGIRVAYVFVDKIQKADLPYYEQLLEGNPDTRVYLAPDISMRNFIRNPEKADVLLCGSPSFVKNVDEITLVNLPEEPYDFETFIEVVRKLVEQLKGGTRSIFKNTQVEEKESTMLENISKGGIISGTIVSENWFVCRGLFRCCKGLV